MLGLVGLITASLCASCAEQQEPVGPRLGVPAPTVDQQISDGCARFQVRFDSGGGPIIEPIYASGFSSYCELNELKLLSDTAGSFDPATGTLRVALVMENMGAAAVIPRVKLRFNADSVSRLDAQGNTVPGTPDILGHQPDSASANGRNAYWFFDQVLAPSGQPQVLMPGARTQRRWLEFRGNGWTDRVRLKLFATGAEASPVPAVAPDSLPSGLFADSNLVEDPDLPGVRYVKRVVSVLFKATATAADRQAAVAVVGGVVIGGVRILGSDGYYLIRLASDTSIRGPKNAVALLEALPAVDQAFIERVSARPMYLRPRDGSGWQQWRVSTGGGSVAGATWALEDVAAPLAWGCAVGSSKPAIAVVDQHFFSVQDLSPNINTSLSIGLGFDTTKRADAHGTFVAGIAAAKGHNDIGMTGLLWDSDLRVYDILAASNGSSSDALSDLAIFAAISRAARDGARVINLSVAEMWTGILGVPLNPVGLDTAVAYVESTKRRMVRLLTALDAQGISPLLVIAAGNRVLDAYWSRFPAAAQDASVGSRVLVVGGSTPARSRWIDDSDFGSSFGNLVGVYAPAQNVYSINGDATIAARSGTSFAAPFATALAGMLVDFDPRLSAQEIKALIIAGADSARLPSDQVNILNAYSSLRLAAKTPGAPLCGNRVWADNGTLWAERSGSGATWNDEALATVASNARSWPNVFHGGKRVQNLSGTGWNAFLWNTNGTWSAAANTFPDSGGGGTWWSSQALDHDLTKRLDAVVIQSGSSARVSVRLVPAPFSTTTEIASIGPLPGGVDSSSSICIRLSSGHCTGFRYNSHMVRATAAMSPQGDRAFVAVAVWAFTNSISTFTPCPGAPQDQCAEFVETYALAAPSEIYEVNLSTGQAVQRWTVPRAVRYLAVSERNDELVASEASFSIEALYQHDGHGSWVSVSGSTPQNSCSIVFRDIQGPGVSGNTRRTLNVNPANACDPNFSKGGGTIAPRVSPTAVGR